jgi:hypothetical protein
MHTDKADKKIRFNALTSHADRCAKHALPEGWIDFVPSAPLISLSGSIARFQDLQNRKREESRLLFMAICGQSETRDSSLTSEGLHTRKAGQIFCHATLKLDESCISILACAHLGQRNHRRHVGEAMLVKRQRVAPLMLGYRTGIVRVPRTVDVL